MGVLLFSFVHFCRLTGYWSEPEALAWVDATVQAEEKGFAPERVQSGIARLKKTKAKSSQGRLDSFFKASCPALALPPGRPSFPSNITRDYPPSLLILQGITLLPF